MRPEPGLPEGILSRFAGPCGAGRPPDPAGWRHGRGGSARQGALVEVWLRVEDDRVPEARFEAFGCPSTIAAAAWFCEWAPGRPQAELAALTGLDLARALGLAAAKRGVALVVEDAVKAALRNDSG